jgi:GntR family transcriptional regulator
VERTFAAVQFCYGQRDPKEFSMSESALGFRPLYKQVREALVKRIADGVWQPGQLLPSEPDIASNLGVSPGTVRKALDEMTADNLVIRRQGRGTYVAKHDDARILFQFFKLVPDSGERHFPESRVLRIEACHDAEAADRLGLPASDRLLTLDRVRLLADVVCVLERIYLPMAFFPGLERREIPNNLYELYATEFGVTVGGAREHLKAVAATSHEAEHLQVQVGDPLLQIDRLAFSIDKRRVEWRISVCRTDKIHYVSDLR